jgi:hypothetical protein
VEQITTTKKFSAHGTNRKREQNFKTHGTIIDYKGYKFIASAKQITTTRNLVLVEQITTKRGTYFLSMEQTTNTREKNLSVDGTNHDNGNKKICFRSTNHDYMGNKYLLPKTNHDYKGNKLLACVDRITTTKRAKPHNNSRLQGEKY